MEAPVDKATSQRTSMVTQIRDLNVWAAQFNTKLNVIWVLMAIICIQLSAIIAILAL